MSELRILIKGRLGNQMFIYAFAKALSLRTDSTPILLDNWMKRKNIANRLDCFYLSPDVLFGHGTGMSLLRRIVRKLAKNQINRNKISDRHTAEMKINKQTQRFGLFRNTFGFSPLPEKQALESRDFYMEGYFQSEKYFAEYKDLILSDFSFKPFVTDSCEDFAQIVRNTLEPTCLHVRLGDYVNNPLHGVADAAYYKQAIAQLRKQKPEAQIFLFSDNIELAKQELGLDDSIICLPENYDDQQTMYIGSLCKNFILSNSSFSWWMQYLSPYKDKMVFAPHKWYAQDVPCDLYSVDWHLIEV